LRALLHDHFRKTAYAVFDDDHVQEHDPGVPAPHMMGWLRFLFEAIVFERKRPAAIRPLGTTGKVPVMTEGMHAIQTLKPWQDRRTLNFRSASRNLAHGFFVWSVRSFENS
jgi:hypothetical protein